MENKSKAKFYDVIIVGAGLAGLSAGYYLKKHYPDIKILVIEGKNRVGGRTQTVQLKCARFGIKYKWDAGGQWICSSQKSILKLIKDFDLKTTKQYSNGVNLMEVNGQLVKFDSDLPKFNFLKNVDFKLTTQKINKNNKAMNSANPFLDNPSLTTKLDNMHLQQYYEDNSINGMQNPIVSTQTRTIYGLEASQINALFATNYMNSSGGKIETLLLSGDDSAQNLKVIGGTQQISELMLENILENSQSHILFENPVVKVSQNEDFVEVLALNESEIQEVHFGRRVILAIPPNQYAPIRFAPELPFLKRNFLSYFKAGNYIKYIITYPKPFWRSNGFSGYAATDGSGYPAKTHSIEYEPVSEVYDATTDDGIAALVCLCGGQPSVQWTQIDYETRKNAVIQFLVKCFGNSASEYIEYYEKNWNLEPFNGGCPTYSIISSNLMKDYKKCTREPFDRVYFCGTETAVNWQGYMDGACESGERVANEVLYDFSRKDLRDIPTKINFEYDKTYYAEIETTKIPKGKSSKIATN